MKLLVVKIEGTQPLLMHNERLANPLDAISKKLKVLTKKGKGVARDNEKIAMTEFEGGLYYDVETGPYVPGWNMGACLKEAAKDERNGKNFSSFVSIVEEKLPIEYKGPRDIEGMWNAGYYDMRMVRNQASKVLRTRPKFDKWGLTFTIEYDEKRLDEETILRTVDKSGSIARLGDYRARYGRFKVVSPQIAKG
jgi:hypothetical protein